MKKLFVILLTLISLSAYGQPGRFPFHSAASGGCTTYEAAGLWKLNNVLTDEKGNGDVTLSGGAVFTTNPAWEGTHGVNCDGASRRINVPIKFYGDIHTINFGFFRYGISGTPKIFGAMQLDNGFELSINMTNASAVYITAHTGNGTLTASANSNTFAMSVSTWYQFTVTFDRAGSTAYFFINGVAAGSGTIRNDYENIRTSVFGGDYNLVSNSYAYFDTPQVTEGWGWVASEALTSYTTPGTEITKCE